MTQKAITVSQLNNYIKGLIGEDPVLSEVCVTGEISNFKRHSSGHLYFTLKDADSVISAVMFRGDAYRLRFSPESGMKVLVFGRVNVYPKSGQYQIYVSAMQPDGIGSLYMAFEQLKESLYKKGRFDPEIKKPLPAYPEKIALVTSPTGAAVRDMIRILRSRFPVCDVIVCPVKVQGDGAAEEIAAMIDYINANVKADLIITGRGGGSLEDLWAFNEEIVAEAIFRSGIPVISAVGHEPDVTISDYVADKRAATPSNAAEIAVPDSRELAAALMNAKASITKYETDKITAYRQKIENLAGTSVMTSPVEYFAERRMHIDNLEERIAAAQNMIIEKNRRRFMQLAASLDAMSPLKVLGRGYAMASGARGVIKSVNDISAGDDITVRFSDGEGCCTVNRIIPDNKEQ